MEKLLSSRKGKIAQLVFYLAFILEIVVMCLNNVGVEIPYRGRLLQLAALIFGVKILLTHYTKKEWIIIIFSIILTCIPFVMMRETLWIQIAMMLIASKDIAWDKSLKVFFSLLSVSILLMAILSACGIIENFVQIKDFDRGGIETRYCFGFSHPNVFYSNILLLLSMGMVLFFDKLPVWGYAILMLANITLFCLSKSRNGFLVVTLLVMGACIIKIFPTIMQKKIIYDFGYLAIGFCVIFSWGVLLIDNPLIHKMNSMLTGRIALAKSHAPIDTWTLWPNTIDRYVVDMGFVKLMASWGILIGFIYILLIFLNYRWLYKQQNYVGVVILLAYTVFTVIEAHAFSMYFIGNVMFLLMIGWGKDRENVSEKESDTGTVPMCS